MRRSITEPTIIGHPVECICQICICTYCAAPRVLSWETLKQQENNTLLSQHCRRPPASGQTSNWPVSSCRCGQPRSPPRCPARTPCGSGGWARCGGCFATGQSRPCRMATGCPRHARQRRATGWAANPWRAADRCGRGKTSQCVVVSTLRASLSGTFLQTLPLKEHSLSPRSCPPTQSAPSERFGY